MISILIPIYNYPAYPLVAALHAQCLKAKIDFEILCIDDASGIFTEENHRIDGLSFCQMEYLPENTGRSRVRNALAKRAVYDRLLFLDADVFPVSPNFIQMYIDAMEKDSDVIYGGLAYKAEKPPDDCLLRWNYGRKREALSVKKRRKKGYETLFFSNILLRKHLFSALSFDETVSGYGYEDLVFGMQLKQIKAGIKHIDNPVYHLQLDTSEHFLEKTEASLHNLKLLINRSLLGERVTRLTGMYADIKKLGLESWFRFFFLRSRTLLRRNLLSNRPSLFLFDLYKLGYFCMIEDREN